MVLKNKIALIDGYGFVFRAYHSLPPLTRNDGTPVGAVYGFTSMLLRLLAGLNVSHLVVVFDSGSKNFRHEIDPTYKANRPPCPEDLIPQFALIREAAEAFNLFIAEKVGFEADDLIATIAKDAAKKDFEVVIVSSDKDLMQLVDDKISMFDAMKNKIIGKKEVEEKFMVPPTQVLDVLSLMGDPSDNIPGIRGIGPKTAAELITNYGTLENLLANLHEIKQEKRREMLQSGVEAAKLAKILISLCETVPMDLEMEQFRVKNIEPQKLVKFLDEQGFRAIKQRVIKDFALDSSLENDVTFAAITQPSNQSNSLSQSQPKKDNNSANSRNRKVLSFDKISQVKITSEEELRAVIKNLSKVNALIFDVDFSKNNKNLAENIIFSPISDNIQDKIYQIVVNNSQNARGGQSFDLFSAQNQQSPISNPGTTLENALNCLRDLLLDPSILKISYKIKEIYKFLAKNGLNIDPIEDIAILAYILNSANNKSDIRSLIDLNLDTDIEESGFGRAFEDLEKDKEPEIFADPNKKEQFFFFKNYAIWPLYQFLKNNILKQRLNFVYERFERPLLPVLAKMEAEGILVDKMKLKSLSEEFNLMIQKSTKEIYALAGEEFNIASPKQLAHILFEKLNLPSGKKSKTGAYSTNSDILENLDLAGHEIASKILEFRHISKLKSTYTDSLPGNIDEKTGRIHTNFSNTSVITGRLSSINPNLQNIPIRSPEGRKIRSAFIAKKGYKLVLADYSQIELRVLAHISDIKALKEAFIADRDIHKITAAQVFKVSEDEVTSEMRRKAKAINFGIIYGISAFGLARQLKIDRKDAANYIESYFATYPGIQNYMGEYQHFAEAHGFVSTITGRKCFINGINDKNQIIRGLAQRLAINAPIQGSAADIIKKAMIDLDDFLSKSEDGKALDAKILLQVHDELILEVAEKDVEKTQSALKKVMENAFFLDVPLKVDVRSADCWMQD